MKTKILIVLGLLLLFFKVEIYAQQRSRCFNTIGQKEICRKVAGLSEDSLGNVDEIEGDSSSVYMDQADCTDTTMLRIRYLERLIELREQNETTFASDKMLAKPNSTRIISYYHGNGYELSILGVKAMAEQIGLSNILFVLAQSVLETGNYKSRVCMEYNNIFGLYDSRNHDYYHFSRWEDSVIAYQKYIQYRYKGGNYLSFLKRIRYAEDPGYIRKVAKLARQIYEEHFKSVVLK